MKRNGKQALAGLTALALTCALAACGQSGDSALPQEDAVKITNVTVASVETRAMVDRIMLPALVHPGLRVVISTEVGGLIEKLSVDKGDRVRAGQPLADIDRSQLQAVLEQAEALVRQATLARTEAELDARRAATASANAGRSLEQARLALEQASRTREKVAVNLENQRKHADRVEKLFQERLVSQSAQDDATSLIQTLEADLRASEAAEKQARQAISIAEGQLSSAGLQEESARLRIDAAAAQLSAQEAVLEQARIRHGKSLFTAPFDGYVDDVFFEEGEFAKVESPVLVLIKTDPMEVRLSLPEQDVSHIKPGQEASLTVGSLPGAVFTGTVTFVALSSDTRTNTYPVEISVPNPDGLLKAGMVAQVTLVRKEVPDAVGVPTFAVVTKEEGKVVFVLDGEKAAMRPVEIGIVENGWMQITEGLAAGEQLIVKGHRDLQDGIQVRVIR